MAFSDLWLLQVIDVKKINFFYSRHFFNILSFLFVVFVTFLILKALQKWRAHITEQQVKITYFFFQCIQFATVHLSI